MVSSGSCYTFNRMTMALRTWEPMNRLLATALLCTAGAGGQQPDTAASVYAKAAKSVVLILLRSSDDKLVAQGSGFLIEGGKIVTNEHVIRGGTPLIDFGGVRIPAKVERTDLGNDLAVLTTPAEISAEPLPLSANPPHPGDSVYVIGNPEGLEKSISTGVVAAVRHIGSRELIQITAPISHGSSGGPVLDSSANVIGVTVGMIEEGQNLNFAVPASYVAVLLRSAADAKETAVSFFARADELIAEGRGLPYSADPDSPYVKNRAAIDEAASKGIELAGKGDLASLWEMSRKLLYTRPFIAISAARRAANLDPTPKTELSLAETLNDAAQIAALSAAGGAVGFVGLPRADELLSEAEGACKRAISAAKRPTAEMYYALGDIRVHAGSFVGAEAPLRRALAIEESDPTGTSRVGILRDLLRVANKTGNAAEADHWFEQLVQTGQATADDWESRARSLMDFGRYADAGQAWQHAAPLEGANWRDWCSAAGLRTPGVRQEEVLNDARECISLGTGKPGSEATAAVAHEAIADTLNGRGVYDEALTHATEAVSLNTEYSQAYYDEAVALRGLHRTEEAINAAKQAIRLSDGKFGFMHFILGLAYFDAENWQFAEQSFEKAAELDPKNDAAAYNVALCMIHLGYDLDAAHWFEETLRRNPNRSDRADLLRRIAALRR